MRKQFLVLAITFLTVSSVSFAGTRRQAIRAASELSNSAYQMSQFAHFRRYPNTSRKLMRIARLADEAELMARFRSRYEVGQKVNQIVSTYISLRQNLAYVPFFDRLRIKRRVRYGINALGLIVFDDFIVVRYAVSGAEASAPSGEIEEQDLDDLRQGRTLEDWSGGAGPISGGGSGGSGGGGGAGGGGFDSDW